MANVTDFAFREMIAKYGKPDVMWTEFVSADGLVSSGRNKLLIDLKFSKKEKPIVAQLFTGHPGAMKNAARFVPGLGFDGLDINMGCPDRAVERQGGGAAMMKTPGLALKIIEAARDGAGALPVSVKTRLGYNKADFGWIKLLLEQRLPALTIHLRTRKEMSVAAAHWELMPDIIKLRDEVSPETLIIGNGDAESLDDGFLKAKEFGCDGVMVGRGIFGKPWFFGSPQLERRCEYDKTTEGKLAIMLEHAKLFEKTFIAGKVKPLKSFDTMKKHFKAYVSGWDGAKDLRVKLMAANNAKEVARIVKEYLSEEKS